MNSAQNCAVMQHTDSTVHQNEYSCLYCNVQFTSESKLHTHCLTEVHQEIVMSDAERDWKWRAPPRGVQTYAICGEWFQQNSCQFGISCDQAHGEQELNEWNERLKYRQMRLQRAFEEKLFGISYTHHLHKRLESKSVVLTDRLQGVHLAWSRSLTAAILKSTTRKWKFTVTSTLPLNAVALFDDAHRQYFEIHSILSTTTEKAETLKILDNQEWLGYSASTGAEYEVTISFCTDVYGTFRQSVVFDFGGEEILYKNICVYVIPIPPEQAEKIEKIQQDIIAFECDDTWTDRNAVITPFQTLDSSYNEDLIDQNQLKKLYPGLNFDTCNIATEFFDKHLSKNNYISCMHTLLYIEELARQFNISKYNYKANLHIVDSYIIATALPHSVAKYSCFGELYAYVNLNQEISEDTLWGRLLLNSCSTVYLSVEMPNVYEAIIEDKGRNVIYLRLSANTVQNLGLTRDTTIVAHLQFKINRIPFCEWHYALDALPDLKLVFPEKHIDPVIPWSPDKQWNTEVDPRLNVKQKEALIAITTPMNIQLPPILLCGPFGTGKTFTLAQSVKEILKQEGTRILICTHSNSAADIYIKDYFHHYYRNGNSESKPLRIYYKKRWVYSVHPIVQKYSLMANINNTPTFRQPTLKDVENRRLIVVTLSSSLYLCNIGLAKGFFTHILLDEAAQTIECEAIIPFFVANPTTRIVLAGDHMQLSPEIYSILVKDCNLHISLLERLYNYYPATFPCKVLLCENYRAHEVITDFTSDVFYEQKLVASGKQEKHPEFYPLTFFTVRGEDVQDVSSAAFYNVSEVYEIVERISKLKSCWPDVWGPFNDQSIGVLTPYSDQVFRIRYELRKRNLKDISVERVLNVQGKQFRAIFLSVVRTRSTCSDKPGTKSEYGFLSDSKLLNTAITRAQSLVAVVGDPITMCTIGRCSKIWEKFLKICGEHDSLHGITLSNLKYQLDGLELKKIYGLNPCAPEFIPRSYQTNHVMEVPGVHAPIPVNSWYCLPNTAVYQEPHVTTFYVAPAPPSQTSQLTTPPPARSPDLIQLLDKVHIPDNNALHDLMNLLPKNMSLARVLQQPAPFHTQWYEYLLNNKGAEAAKRFKYLITFANSAPKGGIEMPSSVFNPGDSLLDLPYLNPEIQELLLSRGHANQINFNKPVYQLPTNQVMEMHNGLEVMSNQGESVRLYQRQSALYNNER